MKVIDLTQKICNNMPVFSEEEKPKLNIVNTVKEDGYKMTCMNIYSHNGTHIDAPSHVFENGETLDHMDIDRFSGSALVVNCTDLLSEEFGKKIIKLDHIMKYGDKAEKAEFILFHTGYADKWGKEEYLNDCPILSIEAADYLVQSKKKGTGADLMSLDDMNSETLPIHKKLLGNGILIVENLNNLNQAEGDVFYFAALPLKYENSDGAPVRAAAYIK
ncbi:MAG: cyclase family protein [Clostridium sp.]